MFNIGFTELIVVLLVAFLVVGPEDLPKVARSLARVVVWLRDLVKEFKKQVEWDEVVREVSEARETVADTIRSTEVIQEIKDVKEEADSIRKAVDLKSTVAEVRDDLTKTVKDTGIRKQLEEAGSMVKNSGVSEEILDMKKQVSETTKIIDIKEIA